MVVRFAVALRLLKRALPECSGLIPRCRHLYSKDDLSVLCRRPRHVDCKRQAMLRHWAFKHVVSSSNWYDTTPDADP